MVLIVYVWSVIYRNMMKKLSVNQVVIKKRKKKQELFVLHLCFVCVGIKCQRKVKKTPGVIKTLEISIFFFFFFFYNFYF